MEEIFYLQQSLVENDDSKDGGGKDLKLVRYLISANIQIFCSHVQQVVLYQVDHGWNANLKIWVKYLQSCVQQWPNSSATEHKYYEIHLYPLRLVRVHKKVWNLIPARSAFPSKSAFGSQYLL